MVSGSEEDGQDEERAGWTFGSQTETVWTCAEGGRRTGKKEAEHGATRQEAPRRMMDEVREDMQVVGVRKEEDDDSLL